jgi:PKD repeat protein
MNRILLTWILLLSGFLSLKIAAQQAVLPQPTQPLEVVFSEKYNRDRILAEQKAKQLNIPLRKELDNGGAMEFEGFDENGQMLFMKTYNIGAARTTSTNRVWPGGTSGTSLTGGGVSGNRLAMWDGGATRITHREFAGRATQVDGATSLSAHATHVAGTMVAEGISTNARGMAYQANIRVYDWNNDNSEMASAGTGGMLISNHSYGTITGWHEDGGTTYWYGDESINDTVDWKYGFYDSKAQQWDQIAFNNPFYLIVKAAGNDRGSSHTGSHQVRNSFGQWVTSNKVRATVGPYDCISTYGNAKNILTVGAVRKINNSNTNNGWTQVSDVVMTTFSGWGPTDDGRIKPDVVGCGQGVNSLNSTHDSAYTSMNGTSMASPNVSGSLFLMQQHYNNLRGVFMRAATLKGLAIHTADEAGNPGPDYSFGWGLINTAKAVALISDSVTNIIQERTLNNGTTFTQNIMASGNQPLRITISWTDRAATPPPNSLNPTTRMLINDLDIRLRRVSDNAMFMPYILDPANPSQHATTGDNIRDNVEQIFIQAPEAGLYVLTVSHKGNLAQNQAQAYSLFVSGIASMPKADFTVSNRFPCTGQSVSFTDQSSGAGITSRMWYFIAPNGQVTTSTLNNPVIVFSQAGNHHVALRVTNIAGTDSIYLPNHIVCGGFVLPFLDNFEPTSNTRMLWNVDNPNNDTTWRLVSVMNKDSGEWAYRINLNQYGPTGTVDRRDRIISPIISTRGFDMPVLQFDHAYQRHPLRNDSLVVWYTTGGCNPNPTWIRLASYGGPTFATVPDDSVFFEPQSAAEWCSTTCRSITLPVAARNANNLRFRFESVNRYGNNIYVDNFRIAGSPLAPVAGFRPSASTVCTNQPVQLLDTSRNFPTAWRWEISGPENFQFDVQNPSFFFTTPGVYSVKQVVTNNTASDSVFRNNMITVLQGPSMPNVVTTRAVLCTGDSAILSTDSVASQYRWIRNGMAIANSNNSQLEVKQPGSYQLQLISANNCTITSQVVAIVAVETPSKPTITTNLAGNRICEGAQSVLTSNGPSEAAFLWSRNTAPLIDSSNQLTINSGGTYRVQVSKLGCLSPVSDPLAITTVPLPQTSAIDGPDLVQPGSTHTYTVTGSSASTFAWTVIGGTRAAGISNSTSVTWSTTATNGVVRVVESNQGCVGQEKELQVIISPTASLINVQASEQAILLYPNPATSSAQLIWNTTTASVTSLQVFDALGRMVVVETIDSKMGENRYELNTQQLDAGIYFVVIKSEQNTYRVSLMVSKP